MLPDVIANVTENLAWANDNRTLFYAKQDETTLRQHQIWRHMLGTDPATGPAGLSGGRRDFRRVRFQDQIEEILDDRCRRRRTARSIVISMPTIRSANSRYFCRGARAMSITMDHSKTVSSSAPTIRRKNFRLMATPVDRAGARALARNHPPSRRCLPRRFRSVSRPSGFGGAGARPDADPRSCRGRASGAHYLEFAEPAYRANLERQFAVRHQRSSASSTRR